MKVLLLGADGQLGWELIQSQPGGIVLETCDFPKVDFLSTASVQSCIQNVKPDWIINAAAHTAVDLAETEPEKADRINHLAVKEIASFAARENIRLIHISTDYVFNADRQEPIKPDVRPDPQSVYGKTKLAGEKSVRSILPKTSTIIRTAWLYSSHGKNFVKTMISLMNTKEKLTVVSDQIGTPTWAAGLAQAIWQTIENKVFGVFHYTDAGQATWFDFAGAIQEQGLNLGLVRKKIPIAPVPTSEYPTPAKRPAYSVLDTQDFYEKLSMTPVPWQEQLAEMLLQIKSTL